MTEKRKAQLKEAQSKYKSIGSNIKLEIWEKLEPKLEGKSVNKFIQELVLDYMDTEKEDSELDKLKSEKAKCQTDRVNLNSRVVELEKSKSDLEKKLERFNKSWYFKLFMKP